MFQRFKTWFAPPAADDGFQRLDLAQVLRVSLFASSLLSLIALVSAGITRAPNWDRLVRDSVLVLVISLILLYLLRRGYVRLVAYGVVAGFGAFAAFAAFTGVGVRGTSYGLFILVVIISALFLHRRMAYIVATIASLIGLTLVWANNARLLPNADRPLAEPATWLIQTAYFFVAAVVLNLALRQIDHALERARRELAERQRAEDEVRRLNAELEQRIAERAAQLAESEERYRLISTIASDYMFSSRLNDEGALALNWVAGAFESITGYTFEEYIARGGWPTTLHPDSHAQDARDMAALNANQRVVTEVCTITQSGAPRWVRVYAQPVWDANRQQLTGIYGAVQDITDRKQAEAAVREAELRYRSLVEQTSVVIYRDAPDADTSAQYISPQIERLLGYTPAEWTHDPLFWQSLLHPDDRDNILTQTADQVMRGLSFTSEYRLRARDGQWVWVRDEAVVVKDEAGQPLYVQGVLSNITKRIQAEAALRASEQRFRTLVEQLPAITYTDDIAQLGRTLYISPQLETLLGYTPAEWIAGELDFWLEHIHPADRARALAEFEQCFQYGEPVDSEYRMLAHDGRVVWFQDRAVRLDQTGQPQLIQGVMMDITDRKRVEQQLDQQAQHLTTLYQLGQEMVASLDLEQVYAATHRAVERLMPTEAFFISLVDEERQEIQDVYLFDQGQRWPSGRYPLTQRNLTTYVLRTGDPLLIHDDADGASLALGRELFGTSLDTRSVLMMPLKLSGKTIGVISTQHYQPNMYTFDHTQGLVMLANQAAIAIQNARAVQSLRLQAAALDAAANAIVISDSDHIIQWVNPAFTTLTGYSSAEALGQATSLLRSEQHSPEFYRQLEVTIQSGQVWHGEIINRRKDGGLYVEEQIITPVRDEQGQVFRFIAIKQDITQRKHAEEALTHERNLLQALMDNIPDKIYFKDLASRFTRINRAQAQLLGLPTPEAAVGKTDLDFQAQAIAQTFYAEEQTLMHTGQPIMDRLEYNPAPDGRPRWLTATKVPVRDAEDRVVGLVGISRDITQRKLAEERDERRRLMMEKVIELGKTITQITDLWQCLREIHQSVQKGLGFDRVGLFLYDVATQRISGAFGTSRTGEIEEARGFTDVVTEHNAWQVALSDPKGIYVIEDYSAFHHLTPDSEMYGVKQHVTLAAWAGETPVALMTSDNGITQRPITEEQLEALQLFAGYAGLAIQNARWHSELERRVAERTAELEFANREIESIAYTIAHDLRIPTRAMHGYAHILNETHAAQLDEEARRHIQRIIENARYLGQLVDDLLAFMRLSRAPVRRQPIVVNELVTHIFSQLTAAQPNRQIDLRLTDLPTCNADPVLLQEIWRQLIANALKFSATRAVTQLEIGASETEAGAYYYIRDNGVGFDMRYVHKLFGPFQRLHHLEEFEGTGMGLAIVRRIVERHGGQVWAEGQLEQGATLYFTLGANSSIG